MKSKKGKVWLVLTLLVSMTSIAQAAVSIVTVSVTVVAPLPCTLNGGKPIEVNFGDEVMTTRIDGDNYRQPVGYGLSCNGPWKNAMRLQLSGAAAGFDGTLLKTSVNGLGIELQRDGVRIPLNAWQNFTYPSMPKLEAVPVKQSGATLPTGEFTASATLRVDYQ
ncbi:TPA: fimbrial protein [Serratia marcescens]|uniref:fimbrial protein n=1 Tax=Serratia sp. CY29653 TaxID=3383594 RepID=UPI001A31C36D|nr:fimbrial protein [Serratia marcescens]HAT4976648.1 fimbrial protein [Serratia marcescens]HAT4990634.1 fimbrial protein [Serratia marcescens]HAT5049273.1 fimbrial protein [Serratia marcescens]HEJ7079747.1 fimbrial protein [Serratia marcescens]